MRQLWKSTDKRLTGPQYSWPLSAFFSHTTKSLLPFEFEPDALEKQDLKEKKAKVPYKETNEWFCCDKDKNGSLPPLVLSFSTKTRKPDKLAIRKVISQAVRSAFAVPLHLLNIMKPCSVALVNIKRIHRLEKTADKQANEGSVSNRCCAQVVALYTQWRSEESVSQSSASSLGFTHCHWIPVIIPDYWSWVI